MYFVLSNENYEGPLEGTESDVYRYRPDKYIVDVYCPIDYIEYPEKEKMRWAKTEEDIKNRSFKPYKSIAKEVITLKLQQHVVKIEE